MMPTPKPIISTILLNWNRSDLLKITLDSYLDTVSVPFELIIIDNGSTDDSAELIRSYADNDERIQTILLKDNLGGAAMSQALPICTGDFIHLSENDLEYLPGWSEDLLDKFDNFDDLGQLSLFSPVPTDDEAWAIKYCPLAQSNGRIIYVTPTNIGTSSMIRRKIIDSGVKVMNFDGPGNFLFPDDLKLSQDIMALGFKVAWNDRYLVRNIGHSGEEVKARLGYYKENYDSKVACDFDGLKKRIALWENSPKPPARKSILIDQDLSPEISRPSTLCPHPQLWSMTDAASAEVEVQEFLYSITRLIKPQNVLESGTFIGNSAITIARALLANGRGKLVTLEHVKENAAVAKDRIAQAAMSEIVEVKQLTSTDYTPPQAIDLLFLDSTLKSLPVELQHFAKQLQPGALVIVHGFFNGVSDIEVLNKLTGIISKLAASVGLIGFLLPTPRGIAIFRKS
jgi:predicted O-methyltransferase YrrM/glycosyltransferase involved in cell wall biosynthesis